VLITDVVEFVCQNIMQISNGSSYLRCLRNINYRIDGILEFSYEFLFMVQSMSS